MRRLAIAILLFAFASAAQTGPLQPSSQDSSQTANAPNASTIAVPAGATVSLTLTHAILSQDGQGGRRCVRRQCVPCRCERPDGDSAGQRACTGPDRHAGSARNISPHAQFQIHFTKLIFANGYTVFIPSLPSAAPGASPAPPDDVIPAVTNPSARSDVLLDNGAQIEMVLQLPLQLDTTSVEGAVKASRPVQPGRFKSATMCQTIPGDSGNAGHGRSLGPQARPAPRTL